MPRVRRLLSQLLWRVVYPALPRRWRLPMYYLYYGYKGIREPELDLLPLIVPTDQHAVDIGANLGLYSYRLARICSRIDAYEPNAECRAVLAQYGHPAIHVHPVALSSAPGQAQLQIPSVGGRELAGHGSMAYTPQGDSHRVLLVPVETLDQQQLTNVGFIKIDVEGHELAVLQGGEATLQAQRPVLLIEIEQRHLSQPIGQVFAWILAHGYRGYYWLGGRLQPLSSFDVRTHQDAVSGAQPYVNNFFFFPVHDRQLMDRLQKLELIRIPH